MRNVPLPNEIDAAPIAEKLGVRLQSGEVTYYRHLDCFVASDGQHSTHQAIAKALNVQCMLRRGCADAGPILHVEPAAVVEHEAA